ncbi:MAG: hypothetical protein LH616_10310 [Ilumatobacteraceae bacterium]|nr:hypothetical protein [Ilumatobacteraceae bacterium]
MPNRTVYLPDALDAASRQLGLNLSQLTQRAIEDQLALASEAALSVRCAQATARMTALDIEWPDGVVATGRREAGER